MLRSGAKLSFGREATGAHLANDFVENLIFVLPLAANPCAQVRSSSMKCLRIVLMQSF